MLRHIPVQLQPLRAHLEQPVRNAPSRDIYSANSMRHREPLEDWYRVCDTITRVKDDAGCSTGRVSMSTFI
jgi:hypothetical protein